MIAGVSFGNIFIHNSQKVNSWSDANCTVETRQTVVFLEFILKYSDGLF